MKFGCECNELPPVQTWKETLTKFLRTHSTPRLLFASSVLHHKTVAGDLFIYFFD